MRSAETGRAEDVTAAAIEKYLAGLLAAGRSPKTVRNHKGAIGRFCQWAKRQGFIATNPAREVDPPPLEELLPHSLTRRELAVCLKIARRGGGLRGPHAVAGRAEQPGGGG